MAKQDNLTRTERQVMEVIYKMDEGTVNDIRDALPNSPSYSATRAVLGRLVSKKMLKYQEKGPRYVYSVAGSLKKAKQTALTTLMNTFFDGSALHTINALLGISADKLSREELEELAQSIAKAAQKEK
jgi:BlaI family transcriptional regulator, penicillinase repressor